MKITAEMAYDTFTMREVILALHNASQVSFNMKEASCKRVIYGNKSNLSEARNLLDTTRVYTDSSLPPHTINVNEFNSEINEIEVNNKVHYLIDKDNKVCSILYRVDQEYVDSLDIMFNQAEVYKVTIDKYELGKVQLLLPESDFFLITFEDELYIFDSTSIDNF